MQSYTRPGTIEPRTEEEWEKQLTEDIRLREANLRLVRGLIDEFVNKGNFDYADQVWSKDYQWHPGDGVSPTMDRISHRDDFKRLRATFPDLHLTIEDMIAEGDKVVTRCRLTGTHTNPLHQANGNVIAPTGKRISWTSVTIHRIAEGKVAEGWINYDRAGIDEQLAWRT
jgi:predicted ester cyclase